MPTSNITYRDLTPALSSQDISDLNSLITQLTTKPVILTREDVVAKVNDPGMKLIVALDTQLRIIGMVTLSRVAHTLCAHCELHDVVVDASQRRNGIGKALIMFAIHQRSRYYPDAKFIELTSSPTRMAANQLYQSLGFHERRTNIWRLDSVPAGT